MRASKKADDASETEAASQRDSVRVPKPNRSQTTAEGSEMLHIRIDRALKRDAAATLDGIGLSMSDAVRLFLNRVVIEQALPLQLKVPNATTRAAIESARALGPGEYSDPRELFDALEKVGER